MEAQYSPGESTVKISIVVPVYNDEEYLPTCLDSLVNQTLQEIEILPVNDGSTDDSLTIMNEYAARDRRIRAISFPENRGPFHARNEGIRHASGKYIMFADADDYLSLNACERVWELEQESPVDILHFGTHVIQCGEQPFRFNLTPAEGFFYDEDVFDAFIKEKYTWTLWNKTIYRELCLAVLSELHEEKKIIIGDDKYFIWVSAALARSYRGCPNTVLYNYRFGLGLTGGRVNGLPHFEKILQLSWVEDAIEAFTRERFHGEYDAIVRKYRNRSIITCVEQWAKMSPETRPAALRLLLRYWSKPGDLGRIVGAFSRVFGKAMLRKR